MPCGCHNFTTNEPSRTRQAYAEEPFMRRETQPVMPFPQNKETSTTDRYAWSSPESVSQTVDEAPTAWNNGSHQLQQNLYPELTFSTGMTAATTGLLLLPPYDPMENELLIPAIATANT